MKNFNTIILYFLPKSGGNFLGACLALDKEFMLHNTILADANYNEKLEYLTSQLDLALETGQWTDFTLGNGQIGINLKTFLLDNLPGGYAKNMIPVHSKKHCVVTHNYLELVQAQIMYPDNQVVLFTNSKDMITSRNGTPYRYRYGTKLYSYWQTVRDTEWPELPPRTVNEFELLPEPIRVELIESFNSDILKYLDYTEEFLTEWDLQPADFKVDVEYMYSSFENFFNVYTDVCKYLNLEIANKSDLSLLFNKWKETTAQLV